MGIFSPWAIKMNILKFLLDRVKEPSTWTALAVLGTLVGMPPGTMEAAHQIAIGVAGIAGVVLAERG